MDKIKTKKDPKVRSTKKSSKSTSNENKKVFKNRDKKIEKSKKEKYSTKSLNDLKTTATRGLNNFRNTFDNFSQKLKLTSITNQQLINDRNGSKSYGLLNGDKTPVQLYSPFCIETPSPRKDRAHLKRSCSRQVFFSPTAKIKEDVLYLNNGIKELNLISEDIENRLSIDSDKQSLI